jgi:hypothetical protein
MHGHECFTGKYTTRRTHTKLHPGIEWDIFHIISSLVKISLTFRFFNAEWATTDCKDGEFWRFGKSFYLIVLKSYINRHQKYRTSKYSRMRILIHCPFKMDARLYGECMGNLSYGTKAYYIFTDLLLKYINVKVSYSYNHFSIRAC